MNKRCFFPSLISMVLLLLISSGVYAADIKAGKREATQCAVCHGDNGEGNGAPKSKISGMDVDTFIKHLQDFKSGIRKNFIMERFAKRLTDRDIENLAAYYATK